ncbi:glutamate receptor U1-like [Ceratina calcarata]|uniref:Glutamate receptor U1-like n=1 Tax=Ceratina calcarata TaxID=156304 RepID=A0AAJ7JD87_9HYME|nr:glutamate receptor U1-like [Ceratina calcarata]
MHGGSSDGVLEISRAGREKKSRGSGETASTRMPRWESRAMTLLLGLLFVSKRLVVAEESLLVRPIQVYEGLIKGVHDYFNNTCIILFHGATKLVKMEGERTGEATASLQLTVPRRVPGLREMERLLALQRYLSGSLSVRTAIMDFHMFETRVGKTYHHIKRPLFVLLNDLDDIRDQFASVSKWIAMAYPTWLLFLRDDTAPEQFLANVYVPFDCVLLVARRDTEGRGEVVRDMYRIGNENHLRSMRFGAWDPARGFQGPTLGLYQRRRDLHGHNIRVVSVQDPPVSRILRDEDSQAYGIGGFFGEVIQLLQEGMNCTFSFTEAKSWGVRQRNGSWTGSIGMLVENQADLAATELMMTSDRLDVVKFTTPVYSTKCRVFIKRPDTTAVKWNAYFAPFAVNIWNALGSMIILVGLMIAGMDAFSKKSEWVPAEEARTPVRISDIVFHVFGVFCGQGMEPSSSDSVRLVHLSVHLMAVVVLAAYSAALISYLAIKTFVMPFTTMQGLLDDGSYRFAVVGDSADFSFFENTTDPVLSIMFEQLLTFEFDLPVNYLDGLTRVCRQDKYAFMTLDNMASVLQGDVECFLEPLDTMMQTTIAMAVPMHSPYRGIIDTNILLLRDSGILQRLLKLEWSRNANRAKSGWTSVELEDATPLLVLMLGAFVVTMLVLLAEYMVARNREQRRRPDAN